MNIVLIYRYSNMFGLPKIAQLESMKTDRWAPKIRLSTFFDLDSPSCPSNTSGCVAALCQRQVQSDSTGPGGHREATKWFTSKSLGHTICLSNLVSSVFVASATAKIYDFEAKGLAKGSNNWDDESTKRQDNELEDVQQNEHHLHGSDKFLQLRKKGQASEVIRSLAMSMTRFNFTLGSVGVFHSCSTNNFNGLSARLCILMLFLLIFAEMIWDLWPNEGDAQYGPWPQHSYSLEWSLLVMMQRSLATWL